MNYTDYFLRFPSKDAAESIFSSLGVTAIQGNLPGNSIINGKQIAIDILFGDGTVHIPTGDVYWDEGYEIPVTTPVEGYHVNVRYFDTSLPEALAPFAINPTTPKCVFI